MDAGPTASSKARIRLRELSVHAIALVPEGANLRKFAEVRKGLTDMDATTKALVLPKSAQDQLALGLTRGIETMTALLDLVKTAQVSEDSSAIVPAELAEQINTTGMMVVSLADQFGAAPPAPVVAPPQGSNDMSPEEMALTKAATEHVQKSARAMVDHVEKVSKGKVRMSFESALKIINGATGKVYEIAATLAPLIAEFGENGMASLAASLGETDKTQKGLQQEAAGGSANVDPMKRVEESLLALRADVDKIAKSRNPSNAGAPRDGGGEAPQHRVKYGQNYSDIVRQEEAQKKGAAT